MNAARADHDMITAWNYEPMVAGGQNAGGVLASTEVFDLGSQTWTSVGAMGQARYSHRLAELPGKQILAIGGYDGGSTKASIELYGAEVRIVKRVLS